MAGRFKSVYLSDAEWGGAGFEQVAPLETAPSASASTAFGEALTASPTPRVQIDAVCGVLTTDHQTVTASGGTVGAANALFVCQTGTGAGGYAVLRSRRILRYRPGQGCQALFTSLYTTPVANSLQLAGVFTATDMLAVGYNGTSFGYLRRIPGACAIYRLTVTVGAGGVETLTVKLDGVDFTIVTPGALSTTATAQLIAARVGGYTGWSNNVSPTSNGSTVTFAVVQAGAANDDATAFVAQTSWSVDKLDGSGPSGMTLDPTKLNVWKITYPYLGAGSITLHVMAPDGKMYLCHTDEYPNTHTATSLRNPSLRLGWIASSLGSTTNLTVKGASGCGSIQGQRLPLRDPVGISTTASGVSTTEYAYLLLRNRGEFAATINQRQVLPLSAGLTCETTARIVRARYVIDPTLSATVNWQYVNQGSSCVEYATPSGVTITGGTQVAALDAVTQQREDLRDLDIRIEPGEVLAIALTTASATATATISMNWHEE